MFKIFLQQINKCIKWKLGSLVTGRSQTWAAWVGCAEPQAWLRDMGCDGEKAQEFRSENPEPSPACPFHSPLGHSTSYFALICLLGENKKSSKSSQGLWVIHKELFHLDCFSGSAFIRGGAAPTLRLSLNPQRWPLSVSIGPHIQIWIPSILSPLHPGLWLLGKKGTDKPIYLSSLLCSLDLEALDSAELLVGGAQCGEAGRLLEWKARDLGGLLKPALLLLALVTIVTSLWSLNPVVFARYSFITRPPLRFPPTGEQALSTFTVMQLTHWAFKAGRGGWQADGVWGAWAWAWAWAWWKGGSALLCRGKGQSWEGVETPSSSVSSVYRGERTHPQFLIIKCVQGPCSHPKFSNFLAFCTKHWGPTSWDCH